MVKHKIIFMLVGDKGASTAFQTFAEAQEAGRRMMNRTDWHRWSKYRVDQCETIRHCRWTSEDDKNVSK